MGRNYRHLCFEERALIETQLRMGLSPAAIAVGLMRARSTVLREMRRNGWQSDFELARLSRHRIAGGYRSIVADRRARHWPSSRASYANSPPRASSGSL